MNKKNDNNSNTNDNNYNNNKQYIMNHKLPKYSQKKNNENISLLEKVIKENIRTQKIPLNLKEREKSDKSFHYCPLACID